MTVSVMNWSALAASFGSKMNSSDSCADCQQSKTRRSKNGIPLQPLQASPRVPECNGFDAIIVSVDRFYNMVHLIPCMKSLNAKGICDLVIQNVACYHDLPDTAVSYRRTSILSWVNFGNPWLRLYVSYQECRSVFQPNFISQIDEDYYKYGYGNLY